MPTQEELKIENANSLIRQEATRSRREAERELKDQRKSLLSQAQSTQERRAIKEAFKGIGVNTGKSSSGGDAKGAVFDVSTENPDPKNKQGYGDRIDNDSIDRVESTGSATTGLPLFPGDAPIKSGGILVYDRDDDVNAGRWSMYPPDHNPKTVDALMVWDDANEEVNWSDEASLDDAGNAEVSILAFEDGNLSKLDGYSATEGILCQNGEPVDVKILINFD